ncbi:MAG: ABC transporter ATP-binding protein [Planctomycetes bacterium]|nr:ABC transporter ATP-binding protein [Planctomycetota bacterium]
MLDLIDVGKSFYDPKRGEVKAVDRISASIPGGVLALVGANGAGKSTLLRLVSTLLIPDRGRVIVDGIDTRASPELVRARLGYLSTTTRMYQRLTGIELLRYVGGFFGLYGAELEKRIAQQSEVFGLDAFIDQRIDGLSTGQLQRLNLARTLLGEPRILILDEPTTGLDILAAWQVVEAVRAATRPDRLIILATHIMHEVERTADRLWVLRKGKLIFDGAPSRLGTGKDFEDAVHGMLTDEAHRVSMSERIDVLPHASASAAPPSNQDAP